MSAPSTRSALVASVRRRVSGMSRRTKAIIGVAIAALLIVMPFVLPAWAGFAVPVGIFFVVVLGLDLFMGQAGQVSLGQTLFMALGAYGGGLLSIRFAIPSFVSMIIMAIVSAGVAYVLGRPFLRLRGYYLALATLGLAVITASLANGLVDLTGGPSGLVGIPNIGIGPIVAVGDTVNYFVVVVVAAIAAWFIAGVMNSQTGRALAAISHDQQAASMLGINASRYKTWAFVLAAVLASIGGSLYAFYSQFISPDTVAVVVALNLVVMIALGGSGTIVGPLIGVLLLQLLPQLGQSFAPYEPLAAGVVLILVITYLPLGMWGGLKVLARRLVRR